MEVEKFWSVIIGALEAIGLSTFTHQMYWGCFYRGKECCEWGKKKGESYKICSNSFVCLVNFIEFFLHFIEIIQRVKVVV